MGKETTLPGGMKFVDHRTTEVDSNVKKNEGASTYSVLNLIIPGLGDYQDRLDRTTAEQKVQRSADLKAMQEAEKARQEQQMRLHDEEIRQQQDVWQRLGELFEAIEPSGREVFFFRNTDGTNMFVKVTGEYDNLCLFFGRCKEYQLTPACEGNTGTTQLMEYLKIQGATRHLLSPSGIHEEGNFSFLPTDVWRVGLKKCKTRKFTGNLNRVTEFVPYSIEKVQVGDMKLDYHGGSEYVSSSVFSRSKLTGQLDSAFFMRKTNGIFPTPEDQKPGRLFDHINGKNTEAFGGDITSEILAYLKEFESVVTAPSHLQKKGTLTKNDSALERREKSAEPLFRELVKVEEGLQPNITVYTPRFDTEGKLNGYFFFHKIKHDVYADRKRYNSEVLFGVCKEIGIRFQVLGKGTVTTDTQDQILECWSVLLENLRTEQWGMAPVKVSVKTLGRGGIGTEPKVENALNDANGGVAEIHNSYQANVLQDFHVRALDRYAKVFLVGNMAKDLVKEKEPRFVADTVHGGYYYFWIVGTELRLGKSKAPRVSFDADADQSSRPYEDYRLSLPLFSDEQSPEDKARLLEYFKIWGDGQNPNLIERRAPKKS